jgi:C-methyltransferase
VVHLRELALNAAGAAAVRAAARLGIADKLGETPSTADQLAQSLDVNSGVLERLLRTLKYYGVFAEVGNGYVHTAGSRLLREDDPHSLKFWVQWVTEPWTWELWPHLDETVRTGRGAFEDTYGTDFFTYLHKEWPESAAVFNKSQTELSRLSTIAIADRLDLKGVRILADIAGGQGYTLAALLEKNPQLNGVLVDLPSVVADPDPRLRTGGSPASRVQLVGGDCLQEIPVAADVYLFKSILEWDTEPDRPHPDGGECWQRRRRHHQPRAGVPGALGQRPGMVRGPGLPLTAYVRLFRAQLDRRRGGVAGGSRGAGVDRLDRLYRRAGLGGAGVRADRGGHRRRDGRRRDRCAYLADRGGLL